MYSFSFLNFEIQDTGLHKESELHTVESDARRDLNYFMRRRAYNKLFRSNDNRLINQKYIMLRAHGTVINETGAYAFHDGEKIRLVQDWIDEHDGKANTLVLMVCSKPEVKISSKRSLVVHPHEKVSTMALSQRLPVRMYVPGYGYVENNRYLLDKAIKGLP